jgi:3-oxoacyl-[acyl-carrier protein] reductase
MRLAGKVAIITGAASGNGREIALRFAQEGADLVLPDTYFDGADGLCSLLQVYGRRAFATRTDVSVKAEVDAMVERVVADLGRIDILVANANVKAAAPFLELAEEDWDRCIAVNLKGVFLCAQAVARQMVRQGFGGCIVTVGSVLGEYGGSEAAAFGASKGGVAALTRSMAVALAPYDIRVNAVAPGLTDTTMTPLLGNFHRKVVEDRTPLERYGHPGDVAAAVTFLASTDASFLTGTVLPVDGGFTAGFYHAPAARASVTATMEKLAEAGRQERTPDMAQQGGQSVPGFRDGAV